MRKLFYTSSVKTIGSDTFPNPSTKLRLVPLPLDKGGESWKDF